MVDPKDTQKGAASTKQSDASATPTAMKTTSASSAVGKAQSGQIPQSVEGRGGPTEEDRDEALAKLNTSQTKPGPVAQRSQPNTEDTQQQGRAGGVNSNQKRGEEVDEPDDLSGEEIDDSRAYTHRWFDPDTDLAIPMDETTGEPYKPGEVPPGWNRPVGGEYRGIIKEKMDCDAEYAEKVAREARDKAIDERERLSNAASERIKREAEETDPAKKGAKESDEPPTMEGGGKKGGEAKDAKVGSDFKTAKK
jgi:hypothetical protein